MNKLQTWFKEHYSREDVEEIQSNGLEGGIHGLTYYNETCALYERFKDEIWDMLWEESKEQCVTVMEFIASFNYCRKNNVGGDEQFKNILVWYAIEYICHNTSSWDYEPDESLEIENEEIEA